MNELIDVIPIEFSPSSTPIVLRGKIYLPRDNRDHPPVILILTGDSPKGAQSSSWEKFPSLFATRGFATFLFDFEGLGLSDGDRRCLSITRAGDDYDAAFAALLNKNLINPSRIGILGSSFGGAVALSRPDVTNRAKVLGLKSPASFLAETYLNEVPNDTINEIIHGKDTLTSGYDTEVIRAALKTNVYHLAEEVKIPTLIVQGDRDEIVRPLHSQLLLAIMRTAHIELLKNVGHSYKEPGAWNKMADHFIRWFGERL